MKTPMQELIETFEEMLSPIDSKVDVDFAIALAKSLLEKEKELMSQVYADGGGYDEAPQPRFENYYNATFNTKEK